MPSPPQSQDRQGPSHLRDSWPPTRLRMRNSQSNGSNSKEQLHSAEDNESHIDPLNYFLSPTPHIYPADTDPSFDADFDMDIDFLGAGIDPPPIIRSISPSSLTGLALPPPPPHPIPTRPVLLRPPTPPRTPPSRLASPDLHFSSSPSSISDEDEYYFSAHNRLSPRDDDGEDYIRLGFGAAGGMLAAPWMRDTSSIRARGARAAAAAAMTGVPASRGRASARFAPPPPAAGGLGAAGRGRTSGRKSPRAWREPSPDVWDIQEETEEEVRLDMEKREVVRKRRGGGKRVRFVLPDREAYV